MAELDSAQMVTIVTQIVEKHGCRLVDIDLENKILNIEGSEEAKTQCALALQEVLG